VRANWVGWSNVYLVWQWLYELRLGHWGAAHTWATIRIRFIQWNQSLSDLKCQKSRGYILLRVLKSCWKCEVVTNQTL